MPDREQNFDDFSLHSALFRGRNDLYFCYIKAARISQAMAFLAAKSGDERLFELAQKASKLPEAVSLYAAGELVQEAALADVYALIAAVRFVASAQMLEEKTAAILIGEYERIARRLGTLGSPSPFLTGDDFLTSKPLKSATNHGLVKDIIKDTPALVKAQDKGHTPNERSTKILAFVKKQGSASIKDIAKVVPECSEKTIQRELVQLIEQGLIRKEGERRWSVYRPV